MAFCLAKAIYSKSLVIQSLRGARKARRQIGRGKVKRTFFISSCWTSEALSDGWVFIFPLYGVGQEAVSLPPQKSKARCLISLPSLQLWQGCAQDVGVADQAPSPQTRNWELMMKRSGTERKYSGLGAALADSSSPGGGARGGLWRLWGHPAAAFVVPCGQPWHLEAFTLALAADPVFVPFLFLAISLSVQR